MNFSSKSFSSLSWNNTAAGFQWFLWSTQNQALLIRNISFFWLCHCIQFVCLEMENFKLFWSQLQLTRSPGEVMSLDKAAWLPPSSVKNFEDKGCEVNHQYVMKYSYVAKICLYVTSLSFLLLNFSATVLNDSGLKYFCRIHILVNVVTGWAIVRYCGVSSQYVVCDLWLKLCSWKRMMNFPLAFLWQSPWHCLNRS